MGITVSRMRWIRNVAHIAKMRKHTQFYWEKLGEAGHLGENDIGLGVLQKDLGGLDTAGSEQCRGTSATSINS